MYGYQFGGLVANTFQSATNDTSNTSSRVLPIIDYNYIAANPILGGELSFDGNAMALTRNNGTDVSRAIAQAKWRRQVIDPFGQVFTPFARARGDIYQIDDPKVNNVALENQSTVVRGTAAAGVTYEYPFVSRTTTGSHVISPIAQFIARPDSVEHAKIPNEDAKSLIYTDALLFEVDKSSGYDRIESGTRSNVGVQYTYNANGGGYARVIAGQSYHVAGRNPYTLGTGLEKRQSDYVLGLYYEPSTMFRFLAQNRFDTETLDVQRTDLFAYVGYGPVQASANYAFNRKNPADIPLLTAAEFYTSKEEILGTLQLKLTDKWFLIGSARFDLDKGKALQDSIGLKYLDECFMLTTTYTETFYTDRDVRPDKQIMVRFELKHLGGFNYHGNPVQTTSAQEHRRAEQAEPIKPQDGWSSSHAFARIPCGKSSPAAPRLKFTRAFGSIYRLAARGRALPTGTTQPWSRHACVMIVPPRTPHGYQAYAGLNHTRTKGTAQTAGDSRVENVPVVATTLLAQDRIGGKSSQVDCVVRPRAAKRGTTERG